MKNHEITALQDMLPEVFKRFEVLFDRFRSELDAALDRASREYSNHMPSKGDVCEAAVRKFLSGTLGSRYTTSDGFVFDSEGNQSRQQDVIVFDDHWSSRLTPRDSQEPMIVPVDSVYATVEVKKSLTSGDLRDAIANIQSVKSLRRAQTTAEQITPNYRLRGVGGEGVRNILFSAVFAFDASRSLEAILSQLREQTTHLTPAEWPDVVAVHGQGIILPWCAPCNSSGARISDMIKEGCVPGYKLDRLHGVYTILGFHFLLMTHLHKVVLAPPNFNDLYAKLAYASRILERQTQQK